MAGGGEGGGGGWQQQNLRPQKRKKNLIAVFCYPLVSKFMTNYNNKIIKKSLKCWNQTTGHEMENDGTKRPAAGLKRNPWYEYQPCSLLFL